jgi:hypothetical protein
MAAPRAEFEMSVRAHQHEEGYVTKVIEHYTSMVPSGVYLTTALAAVGLSLGLRIAGRREAAHFVGLWPPTILLMGVYNKIVKVQGSD